jgi:hypothetical protein
MHGYVPRFAVAVYLHMEGYSSDVHPINRSVHRLHVEPPAHHQFVELAAGGQLVVFAPLPVAAWSRLHVVRGAVVGAVRLAADPLVDEEPPASAGTSQGHGASSQSVQPGHQARQSVAALALDLVGLLAHLG